jgi:hypothetical protein
MPFFPRILVGLVGLQDLIVQRHQIAIPKGQVLESVPQVQQLGAVAIQLARQLGGGDALGEAAEDQYQFAGPPLEAMQGRVGKGVEDPLAVAAAEVQDRVAAAPVDDHAVVLMAARAGEAVGMQPLYELLVAGPLVHQVDDREIHGRLRVGDKGDEVITRVSPNGTWL